MTPEEAARGDIPEQYVTVLGVHTEGDRATVWMLTNDRAPYEAYTVYCSREGGEWQGGVGSNSLGGSPPPDVLKAAADLVWDP